MHFSNFIAATALLLISSGLMLGASELGVRVLEKAPVIHRINPGGQSSAYQLSANPVLGYSLKANFRSSAPDQHDSFAYTNAHAQRDHERSYEKPEGVKRIVVLGDSVVAGHGIRELEQLIPQQLEQKFSGENVEVLNLGVGGYCTRAEIELLLEKGLRYDPDVVIVVFVENDFINSNDRMIRRLEHVRPTFINELFLHSHFFRWLAMRYNLFSFRDEHDNRDKFVVNTQAVGEDNVDSGFALLRSLADKHEFDVFVAIWPTFSDDSIYYGQKDWVTESKETLRAEEKAAKHQLATLRLDSYFKKNFLQIKETNKTFRRPSPRWNYTTGDGTHPSPLGAQVAASALHDYIVKKEL